MVQFRIKIANKRKFSDIGVEAKNNKKMYIFRKRNFWRGGIFSELTIYTFNRLPSEFQ